MPESLFKNVAGLRHATLLKKNFDTAVFLRILRNFQEQLFYRTPLVAASTQDTKHSSNYSYIE